jgi:hypothetical protein
MPFYDFIEIGTSDFDTEIEKNDNKVGISVEPIKYYLERLPNKQNCIKLNIGISNYVGTCVVNYLSEQTIQAHNFPCWVRGCNSVNSYHKTVTDLCISKGIDIQQISEKDSVNVTTLCALMNDVSVDGVYFLKIDTEGHDTVILEKFYEEVKNSTHLPHVIQFESNVLSSREAVNHIIRAFQNIGYDLIFNDHDTVLKLNLNRIRNKTKYTDAIKNYYIMDYPLNYSVSNLPHENTLEGAKEYCTKHGCSGITLQDGIYQVRNGKYMNYHKGDISSWIFMNEPFNANAKNMNVYCFWTGKNEFTENRKRCLEHFKKTCGCNVIFVDTSNLSVYILKDQPLHPAYEYLSETHRADYLRTYFMHFYGGGYTDIKETTGSWINGFNQLENDDNKWICGYPEACNGVAYGPVVDKWRELIGNGAYICKPQTPLTTEWYNEMVALLDSRLERLKRFPATYPQDNGSGNDGYEGYPIEWNEMLGRIFHKVTYKYRNHLFNTLPISIFNNYR